MDYILVEIAETAQNVVERAATRKIPLLGASDQTILQLAVMYRPVPDQKIEISTAVILSRNAIGIMGRRCGLHP